MERDEYEQIGFQMEEEINELEGILGQMRAHGAELGSEVKNSVGAEQFVRMNLLEDRRVSAILS